MKSRIIILMLSGLFAGGLAVVAQNHSPAEQATAGDTGAANQDMTNAAATTESAAPAADDTATEATNTVDRTPASATTASAETNAPLTETPGASSTTNEAAMSTSSVTIETNSVSSTNAVIPLVVMDDVPLTDAIKNLARQAGINYMLDPKIAYGQPGPNGKIVPQPSVSIRWENITAGQALKALLANYNLQLVVDKKTHIARVTPVNPAKPPLVTKILQLQFASPTNIVTAVRTVLTDPRSRVVPDIRTSQLVVRGTEKEMDAIDQMLKRLDKPNKQVLIEAKLIETSMNPQTTKGIDWSSTLRGQNITFGNGTIDTANSAWNTVFPGSSSSQTLPGGRVVTKSSGSSQSGVVQNIIGNGGLSLNTASGLTPNIGFLNADGVRAVLSFLNQDSRARVLSEPRTVTLDNETAHLEVGQDYPIINVTAGTANTTGGSQITYSNLTVSLDVTPRISANNYINLRLNPHIMRLDHVQNFVVGSQSFDVPIFDTRDLQTSVMIPSGNTLVMGGLVQDQETTDTTKVPLLGDIPLVGHAFRSKSKSRKRSNLLIFITPTIITDKDYQPTKTTFLNTPVPPEPTDHKWSAWDSTKPYDWSKLKPKSHREKKEKHVFEDYPVKHTTTKASSATPKPKAKSHQEKSEKHVFMDYPIKHTQSSSAASTAQ